MKLETEPVLRPFTGEMDVAILMEPAVSASDISMEGVDSLPASLQQKLSIRRSQVLHEIESFREHKLRDFDLYQKELLRVYAQQQQLEQLERHPVTLPEASIPSSLKGRNKRQRNGEKKKVMFVFSEELPPVSPSADVVPELPSGMADYYQLPSKLSLLSVGVAARSDNMEADASYVSDAKVSPRIVPGAESSNELPLQLPPAKLPHSSYPSRSGADGSAPPTSNPGFGASSYNRFTSSTIDEEQEYISDSDDVFALDETLHSSFADRPSFAHTDGRLTSFSSGPHVSAVNTQYGFPRNEDDRVTIGPTTSGWTGNSSFHIPSVSRHLKPSTEADSNPSSFDDDDAVAADVGISTFGSSLPIEIGTSPGAALRSLSMEGRLLDDSNAMGLPGGVLGDDEEYQLQKIKSFDNPDKLSFSRRIMWEQHVGSHSGR